MWEGFKLNKYIPILHTEDIFNGLIESSFCYYHGILLLRLRNANIRYDRVQSQRK